MDSFNKHRNVIFNVAAGVIYLILIGLAVWFAVSSGTECSEKPIDCTCCKCVSDSINCSYDSVHGSN